MRKNLRERACLATMTEKLISFIFSYEFKYIYAFNYFLLIDKNCATNAVRVGFFFSENLSFFSR